MNKADHTFSVPFDPTSITIHVDTSCRAVYVQFTSKPVVRTLDCSRGHETVTVDMDAEGQAVGVEAIGLKSLSINRIFETIKPHLTGIQREQLDNAELSASAVAV
ncbi:MAG: hypothetical protein GVY36_04985 [Verrucomicrobia bacterium]|jgi:uncharacterized protein YuzE|nr:hypothetical protein [Verrucomicrobiota bacterium]